MSVLSKREIVSGLVAAFDSNMLKRNPQVTETIPQYSHRDMLNLCVRADADICVWTPLVKWKGADRIELDSAWKVGGHWLWKQAPHYLLDPNVLIFGPIAAFVAASYRTQSDSRDRARINDIGMSELLPRFWRREINKIPIPLIPPEIP